MRYLAAYVMRGRTQAMLVAVTSAILSMLLTPLIYISAAVIALIILRQGWREGLWVIAGATLALSLFSLLVSMDPRVTLGFLAVIWLPLSVLALVLRATVSLPLTLSVLAGMGILAVLVVHGVLGDPAQYWRDLLNRLAEQVQDHPESEGFRILQPALEKFAPHVAGWFIASAVLSLVMSLFLARWWQALLYNPGGFRREFHALRLGRSVAWIVLVSGIVGLLAPDVIGNIATDIVIVMLFIFAVHGAAVVHGLCASFKLHVGWLVLMYVVVFFIFPPLLALVAVAGIVDSWMDFRGRLTGRSDETGVK